MSQAERIKVLLERQIVSGRLKPGEKLEENEIARTYEVSRTPVREALMKLEAINLIERRPRQGAVVRGITLKRLVQMLEVCSSLEGIAGGLAARRIKEEQRAELIAAYEACAVAEKAGDPDNYYDANIEFHKTIFHATNNEILIEQLYHFGERLEPFIRQQHHKDGWLEKTMIDHKAILDSILKGRSEEAADLMRRHVYFDTELFVDFASILE